MRSIVDNFRVRRQLALLPACPAGDTGLQFLQSIRSPDGLIFSEAVYMQIADRTSSRHTVRLDSTELARCRENGEKTKTRGIDHWVNRRHSHHQKLPTETPVNFRRLRSSTFHFFYSYLLYSLLLAGQQVSQIAASMVRYTHRLKSKTKESSPPSTEPSCNG